MFTIQFTDVESLIRDVESLPGIKSPTRDCHESYVKVTVSDEYRLMARNAMLVAAARAPTFTVVMFPDTDLEGGILGLFTATYPGMPPRVPATR